MSRIRNLLDKKGQGSLEYLLILAAVLAIAVVVVVVARSMMAPARTRGQAEQDRYDCGLSGLQLKNYNEQIVDETEIPSDKWGGMVTYQQSDFNCSEMNADSREAVCTIGEGDSVELAVSAGGCNATSTA